MQEQASFRDGTADLGEVQQQFSHRQQQDHGDDTLLLSDVEGTETNSAPDGVAPRSEDQGAGTGLEISPGILVQVNFPHQAPSHIVLTPRP